MTNRPRRIAAARRGGIAAGLLLVFFASAATLIAQEGSAPEPEAPAAVAPLFDRQDLLAPPAPLDQQPLVKRVLTDDELREKYVWATLGIGGAINATAYAALTQWWHYPDEWTGAAGFGQRWASAYGESAIAETTKYAVARAFRHDPSFTPCRCSGFRPRLRYALIAPFTSRKRDGRRVLSPAIFAGLLAGQMVSRSAWYPPGYGVREGLLTTATGLASKMAASIWKEFRPRDRNLLKLDSYKP